MTTNDTFGTLLRNARLASGLPLRKAASLLDIDQSTLSKIERNERQANKEFIEKFSNIFELNQDKLLVEFLSERLSVELAKEDHAIKILKVAERKIKYKLNNQ